MLCEGGKFLEIERPFNFIPSLELISTPYPVRGELYHSMFMQSHLWRLRKLSKTGKSHFHSIGKFTQRLKTPLDIPNAPKVNNGLGINLC